MRRASRGSNAAQAASEGGFHVGQIPLVLQGVEQFGEAERPILEFQRDFHARIAHQIDRAVLADQRIELAEQTVLDGLTHQVAPGGRNLVGPLAQAVGRPFGQRRQILAGNLDDLGNVYLDLHIAWLLER